MWKVLERFWKRRSVTRLLTIHIRQFSNYTAFSDIWPNLYYSYRFLLDSKNTIRHLLFTLSEIIAFSIKCFCNDSCDNWAASESHTTTFTTSCVLSVQMSLGITTRCFIVFTDISKNRSHTTYDWNTVLWFVSKWG